MRSREPKTACSWARSASRARADAGDSLGYWIGRPYWGHGYATAAARAIIALAFSRLDIDVLTAIHLVRNPASGRVLAKCGMSELRREMRPHRDGTPEEFRVWMIDRDAWDRACAPGMDVMPVQLAADAWRAAEFAYARSATSAARVAGGSAGITASYRG